MIAGITRVRNEAHIIRDTLDHVSRLVDRIYVYDDCSDDLTYYICRSHHKTAAVLRGTEWAPDPEGRNRAEGDLRQAVYEQALKDGAEWIYCFDADEFADFNGIDFTADAYRLRLFDFYITPEDRGATWKHRRWMGPEYRDILMLFRAHPDIRFHQREPGIPARYKIEHKGFVKHYGKAISVEEWERTCDYYINHRGRDYLPQFTAKWEKRKGRAVHTMSDFGAQLITWEQRHKLGIPLEKTQEWR